MPSDSLLRRVRWGNVARLVALPAIVALVVLWPRPSPSSPRLSAADAAPVPPAPRVRVAPAGQPPPADSAGGTRRHAKQSRDAGARGESPAARKDTARTRTKP